MSGEKLLPCFECQGAGWVEDVEPGCCGNFTPHSSCRGDCAIPVPCQRECSYCGGAGQVPLASAPLLTARLTSPSRMKSSAL